MNLIAQTASSDNDHWKLHDAVRPLVGILVTQRHADRVDGSATTRNR